jgi:hypothetical protein
LHSSDALQLHGFLESHCKYARLPFTIGTKGPVERYARRHLYFDSGAEREVTVRFRGAAARLALERHGPRARPNATGRTVSLRMKARLIERLTIKIHVWPRKRPSNAARKHPPRRRRPAPQTRLARRSRRRRRVRRHTIRTGTPRFPNPLRSSAAAR